jgi:hypothetical protein
LERFRASLTIYTATWLILVGGAVLEAVFILNGIARWPELFVLGVSGFQASLILYSTCILEMNLHRLRPCPL